MIWIDSSFAIEWLLGTKQAEGFRLSVDPLYTLPMQYMETLTILTKQGVPHSDAVGELERLSLVEPQKGELHAASNVYLRARKKKSKCSLADALLAVTVASRGGSLLSFDEDFRHLGLKSKSKGRWAIQ